MKSDYFSIYHRENGILIQCQSEWTLFHAGRIEKDLKKIPPHTQVTLDFSAVKIFDTAGILLLIDYDNHLSKKGGDVSLRGFDEKQQKLYALLLKNYTTETLPVRKASLFYRVGKGAIDGLKELKRFFRFSGHLFVALLHIIRHPRYLRLREVVYHIEKSGVDALLIVALTSLLIGLVIAYQSAVQLTKFGVDIFIVDTIGISITRELSPLITAIVIAGRSGSAYTAEIGAMKITEEISAMRIMGFDPYMFLAIPRIIALIIVMPLLVFFSDIMGILGGMIAAKAQLDISFAFFIDRLQEVLKLKHYLIGIAKAPFFALIIASVGSYRGFHVSSDTESIGLQTTASVVNAIFLVIACDALFSIIFTEFGV